MTTQPFSPPQQEFGTLRLQVSTALGAFPVPNATIEVLSENGGALLYRGITDQSGIADGLALPAKPREASQNAVTAPRQRSAVYRQHHPSRFCTADPSRVTLYGKRFCRIILLQ